MEESNPNVIELKSSDNKEKKSRCENWDKFDVEIGKSYRRRKMTLIKKLARFEKDLISGDSDSKWFIEKKNRLILNFSKWQEEFNEKLESLNYESRIAYLLILRHKNGTISIIGDDAFMCSFWTESGIKNVFHETLKTFIQSKEVKEKGLSNSPGYLLILKDYKGEIEIFSQNLFFVFFWVYFKENFRKIFETYSLEKKNIFFRKRKRNPSKKKPSKKQNPVIKTIAKPKKNIQKMVIFERVQSRFIGKDDCIDIFQFREKPISLNLENSSNDENDKGEEEEETKSSCSENEEKYLQRYEIRKKNFFFVFISRKIK